MTVTSTDRPISLGSSLTERPDPSIFWAITQLSALSFHVPLAILTGSQAEIASTPSALRVGVLISATALAVYLLLGWRLMTKWSALALTSVSTIFFWHWDTDGGIGPVSGPLWALLLYVLVATAAVRFSRYHYVKIGLFVASVTMGVSLLALVLINSVTEPEQVTGVQEPVEHVTITDRPDIVLVVLDGYGRADVMADVFGFDNTPFLDGLRSHGFDVASRSVANYSSTHLSVAALMNMSYMHPEGASISDTDLRYLADQLSGDSDLIALLKDEGYTYVHGASDHWYNTCGPRVDICLPGPLIDLTAYVLLIRTPIGGLLYPTSADPGTYLNRMRIDQLKNWEETSRGWGPEPTFTFLHLLLPHPPLYLDSNCDVRVRPHLGGRVTADGNISRQLLDERRSAWIEQVECANGTIMSFLETVDPGTVVVLVSDHGPDSVFVIAQRSDVTQEQVDERLPNLTAVRLPQGCRGTLPEDVDLVNTFRHVLACISDDNIASLQSRTYVAGFGGPIVEVKVSGQNADE